MLILDKSDTTVDNIKKKTTKNIYLYYVENKNT